MIVIFSLQSPDLRYRRTENMTTNQQFVSDAFLSVNAGLWLSTYGFGGHFFPSRLFPAIIHYTYPTHWVIQLARRWYLFASTLDRRRMGSLMLRKMKWWITCLKEPFETLWMSWRTIATNTVQRLTISIQLLLEKALKTEKAGSLTLRERASPQKVEPECLKDFRTDVSEEALANQGVTRSLTRGSGLASSWSSRSSQVHTPRDFAAM